VPIYIKCRTTHASFCCVENIKMELPKIFLLIFQDALKMCFSVKVRVVLSVI